MVEKFKSIGTYFYESVLRHENKTALVDQNIQLTYRELYSLATSVSLIIEENQERIKVQEVVAVCTEKNRFAVSALFGILQAGRVYLPIDLDYPEARIKFLLEDSGTKLIITDQHTQNKIEKIIRENQLDIKIYNAENLQISTIPNVYEVKAKDCDLAYLIYTSGTSGIPKGVEVEHCQLFQLLEWCNSETLAMGCASTLQFSPLSFDPSLLEIFTTLLNGKKLFMLDSNQRKDITFLLAFIISNNIERLFIPVAILNLLSEEILDSGRIPLSVKEINCGGDKMIITQAIREALKKIPQVGLNNQYGPTEAAIMVTNKVMIGDPAIWPHSPGIGEIINGVEILVVDEFLNKTKRGELLLSGKMLARSYRNRKELTEEKFITIGLKRFYRTGDLVSLEDEGLVFLGRIDNQIKINGVRVEKGEIEKTIEAVLKIPEVAVESITENDLNYLVAFIPIAFSVQDLRNNLVGRLPSAIIPNDFVEVEKLPLTSNGKIDRSQLKENYMYKKNNSKNGVIENQKVSEIVKVFKKVLGRANIDEEDSFFDNGGTSLQAINAVRLINKIEGFKLTIADFYSHPTANQILQILQSLKKKNKNSQKKEHQKREENLRAVAIVGMSCRFPQAESVKSFWNLILNKQQGIDEFSKKDVSQAFYKAEMEDSNYVFARGILKDIDLFDANFFDINPRVAELFDPQMRILLEESVHALESAGISPYKSDEKIGVFMGMSNNNYFEQVKEVNEGKLKSIGDWSAAIFNEKDYVATHISHKLNLLGPSISIHTACSTSLVAIINAYKSIIHGECDTALAGGVNINSFGKVGHLYNEGGINSKDGKTRSFDKNCSGTVFSDGVGVIVLKDLERAIEDGDQIIALIKGAAINNDGKNKTSFTAPSVDGQRDVIQSALTNAEIDPFTIELVEGHGTGTPVGDPIEVQALCEAWEEMASSEGRIKIPNTALGSVKSQIGHTVAASGVAGAIKACLAIKNRILPATINFEKLNPLINLEQAPFYINSENKNWDSLFPVRRAAISSFGVGGTNAHLILEEYISPNRTVRQASQRENYLFCFSARSIVSLKKNLEDWTRYLESEESQSYSLEDLSYSLYVGRNDYEFRTSIVVQSRDQLIRELQNKCVTLKTVKESKKMKSLWGFSGQGESCIGLGMNLHENDPVFRESFNECVKILNEKCHVDILKSIHSDEKRNLTFQNQPYIFIYQYALARSLQSLGVKADFYLGHSLGEYIVGVLSGVFTLEEAILTVVKRAELMHLMPLGAMLSVKISEVHFIQFLKTMNSPPMVEIAAINGSDNIVLSGEISEIDKMELLLKNEGFALKRLATSHAFHSSMMNGVLSDFGEFLDTIPLKQPRFKNVSSATGEWEMSRYATKDYWLSQIARPVYFSRSLEKVLEENFDHLIDLGPRGVFSQLSLPIMKEQNKTKDLISMSSGTIENEYRHWLTGVGRLWEKDSEVSLLRVFKGEGQKVPIPEYSFEHKSYWAGYSVENKKIIKDKNNNEKGLSMEKNKKRIFKKTLEIFSDISGVRADEINPEAQFLELGFDSLMLTQVALEVERTFDVKVSFRQLLETYVTVNSFVDYIISQAREITFEENPISNPLLSSNQSTETESPKYSSFQMSPLESSKGNKASIEELMAMQLDLMKSQIELLKGGRAQFQNREIAPNQVQMTTMTDDRIVEEIKPTVDTAKIAFGAQARIKTTNEKSGSIDAKINVQKLMDKYISQTKSSKDFTQKHRSQNADPRVVTGFRPEIKEVVYPIVVNRSEEQHLWDLDGNEYVDMICGFGSNFFGNKNVRINKALHEQLDTGYEIGPQHQLVGECASLICEMSKMERAAFCNTGSEAVLGALRISRTITGRKKVVMFKGSYHGINDEVIVRGLEDGRAMPAAAGINRASVADVIVLDYGTEASLTQIRKMAYELAAVIVEPVQSRRANFRPVEFLKELRKITQESKTALIFDEVITGFRIAPGGAQEYFGIRADIATYGKIIGGGLPIGVIAGSRQFLDALDGGHWQFGDESAPEVGLTYFAGTFVRHPLALRAMREALLILKEGGAELYNNINSKADEFVYELNLFSELMGAPITIDHFGGVLKPRFLDSGENYDLFFLIMRLKGVHCYDGFPWFITLAHTDEDLKFVITKYKESILEMQKMGFFPKVNLANELSELDYIIPPLPGARLGRDEANQPCWFKEDLKNGERLKKITK